MPGIKLASVILNGPVAATVYEYDIEPLTGSVPEKISFVMLGVVGVGLVVGLLSPFPQADAHTATSSSTHAVNTRIECILT